MTTKILLVRHGHVAGISPERFRGRADLPLTPEGRAQAEATSRRIGASWRPAAVYVSPLSRCRDTGAAIGNPFGLAPIPLDGLVDLDYGAWQGLTPDEVRARWPAELELWHRAPDRAALPGGETLQKVEDRVAAALQAVHQEHRQETVVMVGHDSVNRVLLMHALGVPLSKYWHVRQSPCAINEIDLDERGFFIITVNQTDHLRDI
ncbi:MAG: histidine phosphatase family protein [Stellaceae bacterium]